MNELAELRICKCQIRSRMLTRYERHPTMLLIRRCRRGSTTSGESASPIPLRQTYIWVHRSEHRIAIPHSKSTQYTLSISCLPKVRSTRSAYPKRKKAQKNPRSAGASRGALRAPSRQGAAWTGSAGVPRSTCPPPARPLRGRLRQGRSAGASGKALQAQFPWICECPGGRRGPFCPSWLLCL